MSNIAVVIPCYKVEKKIVNVVANLPDFVDTIILVDDCSPDSTGSIIDNLKQSSPKIHTIHHDKNQGVGGAMITGFKSAISLGCDVVVKIDGDGQMDEKYIEKLTNIVLSGKYDFAKGNRFFNRTMISKMPWIRRIGNLGMGFLIKLASGYWDISDPTNGFFCIKTDVLKEMDFSMLSKRFFFESSLLIELYYTGAKIRDVAMPAIYADEVSNLSVTRTLLTFPPKLFRAFVRRIRLRYFVYDFNICSIYILFGLPMFFFGLVFGLIKWHQYSAIAAFAPTGTIMLSVLCLVIGFQMLLASIQYDITDKNPFDVEK